MMGFGAIEIVGKYPAHWRASTHPTALIVFMSFGIAHGNPVIAQILFALLYPTELLAPLFGFDGRLTKLFFFFVFVNQLLWALVLCVVVKRFFRPNKKDVPYGA